MPEFNTRRFTQLPTRRLMACLLAALYGCILGWHETVIAGDSPPTIQELITIAQAAEQKCLSASYEISSTGWNSDASGPTMPIELKRFVQWPGSFHSTEWRLRQAGSIEPVKIVWHAKNITTILQTPGAMIRYRGTQVPDSFQPFDVLVQSLGFAGTLSHFLRGEPESLMPLTCEVVATGERDGLKTILVKGIRQYPGSSVRRVIELELLPENGCLPCFGRSTEELDGTSHLKAEAKVSSYFMFDETLQLMRDCQIVIHSNKSGSPQQLSRTIFLEGTKIDQRPAQTFEPPAIVDMQTSAVAGSQNYVERLRANAPNDLRLAASTRFTTFVALNFFAIGLIAFIFHTVTLYRHSPAVEPSDAG